MAHKERMRFIGAFLVVGNLLFSLAITSVAAAQNPVPLINQPLVPDGAMPGGAGFTLTVNGMRFVSGSVVNSYGTTRATTFVSSSKLRASISASDIAKPATASVTVVNPGPGGGSSNVIFFEITIPNSSLSLRESDLTATCCASSVVAADFNGDGKLDLALDEVCYVLFGHGELCLASMLHYGGTL